MKRGTSRFLEACHGRRADCTPIWLMRQAGRYMPEYRALRERFSMLDCINTPHLAAEITLQPIEAFDLDAAIIFSDILPPLQGMGLPLEFVKGVGPRLDNPVRNRGDIERLATPPMADVMSGTLEAIRLVRQELRVPLIGFSGAPFTLASYAIEGGGSKSYAHAKGLMYSDPEAWHELMGKLSDVVADYLTAQAEAGVDALQVFDSWAGAVGRLDYERFVQPYTRRVIEAAQETGLPVINFSTGTSGHLDAVAAAGGDVVGVDFRLPLDSAWEQVGLDRNVMGNLDPVLLHAPWETLRGGAEDVLRRAAARPGHVFNVGHGILPHTPVDNVRRLVDYVHESSAG
ncbi:MAG: uroporphyrinogen decarboxylase [Rhodothermales bacterium]|nr:uroporphyrinogen decarboxylase [Rhodothermales bacterium]MBO6778716.1 uroporphyrinogen decarboxylase [Rhodothermales bacterium]